MIHLTPEQSRAVAQAELTVVDPQTQETYVLVRTADLERLKSLLGDDGPLTSAEVLDRVMAEDDLHDPYLAQLQEQYRDKL